MAADAEDHAVRIGGGDARRALSTLEAAANAALDEGLSEISLGLVERAVSQAAVRCDRDGDQYDTSRVR